VSNIIQLGETVTIQNVEAMRERIVAAFEDHADVALDASAVAGADLSLLQLVEAARQHAVREGKTIRLTAPANPVLAGLLERAGFLAAASPDTSAFWFHGDPPQ